MVPVLRGKAEDKAKEQKIQGGASLISISSDQVKKWYVELRYGSAIATPLFSYSSFVLIAYNFTGLQIIPFPIFAVLFTAGLVTLFVILGRIFRTKQMSTDQDVLYAQQRENARTMRIIMEYQKDPYDPAKRQALNDRIEFLKKIENNGRKLGLQV